jgi:hypothetical protein
MSPFYCLLKKIGPSGLSGAKIFSPLSTPSAQRKLWLKQESCENFVELKPGQRTLAPPARADVTQIFSNFGFIRAIRGKPRGWVKFSRQKRLSQNYKNSAFPAGSAVKTALTRPTPEN